ncbi:AAA family ATPase [Bradyrhizobium canariense]|uniref:ATP-dependent nuclease n=1 Tax=Bradyrhizobium canariense TaxID=255045 RepID=UPI001CA5A65C|nr:AAA family ATPase [Bradyrhizobium canariense]MBW5439737.1 AAA family ATPase [Bradyrhizobium canariense]
MKISHLFIENFRGISAASVLLPDHAVLIGDNNVGKSTLLEALDLVMGPDRLSRQSPIDEHDFHLGQYLAGDARPDGSETAPRIIVEATVTGLSEEQQIHFRDYIEWWDVLKHAMSDASDPAELDLSATIPALRVTFIGSYNPQEDDFEGKTYYTRTIDENEKPEHFTKSDKQKCGFLYLRSLRTGARALSLERGSLLDIILRLKEIRPKMWESTLSELSNFDVASAPELGISGVLSSIDRALKKYVPREWGIQPHLRVSALTRRHLREVITAFIDTGTGSYSAPYFRQGTGTINLLLLAMLSQIAEDKQNVIFAMEEPETAIPPYAQKRIVHELRKLSAQTLFTSHSPYVLEEFTIEETVVLSRSSTGKMLQSTVTLPDSIKLKRYRQQFRTRFCESLLARRVLVAEGATEATALSSAARRLSELNPQSYSSLEALGISVLDAGSETQIVDLARLYAKLDKEVFAFCDKQSDDSKTAIEAVVKTLFMHDETGMENLVLKNTSQSALKRFASGLDWPPHIKANHPNLKDDPLAALAEFFGSAKGNWGLADYLAQCSETEMPQWIRDVCISLKRSCEPVIPSPHSEKFPK